MLTGDIDFPAGLIWEPLKNDEYWALNSLIARIETSYNPPYRTSAQEVKDRLTGDTFLMGIAGWTDADHAAQVAGHGRQMIAFATVAYRRGRYGTEVICRGGVDPSFRDRGIGTFLIDWQTKVAHQKLLHTTGSRYGHQGFSIGNSDTLADSPVGDTTVALDYCFADDGDRSGQIDVHVTSGEADHEGKKPYGELPKTTSVSDPRNTSRQAIHNPARYIVTQVDGGNSTLTAHLHSLGYVHTQTFLDLRAPLKKQLPTICDLGPHLKIIPWDDSMLELILGASHQVAGEGRGGSLVTPEQWHEEHNAFVPEWSFLALSTKTDRSRVAGFVVVSRYEQDWEALGGSEGYIDRMSVFETWRHDHVADALIRASMQAQRDSHIDYIATGLSEQNNSDLVDVYKQLGFHVVGKSYLYTLSI